MPTRYWLVDRNDLDRLGKAQGMTKTELKAALEHQLKQDPSYFDHLMVIRGSELVVRSHTTVALGGYPRNPWKHKNTEEETHG